MDTGSLKIILLVLFVFAALLWIKTLVSILASDIMRITKLFLIVVIVSFPPLGVIYPIFPLIASTIKKGAEGAPQRIEETGNFVAGFVSWFFKK